MTFIGMISDHKSFDKVKEELKEPQLELININKKSIGNIKNIKFEIIIINSNLENFTNEINIIEKLCSKSKYVIINTDINLQFEILNQDKTNIITYGLNQKADVTVSSITDTNILIYLQKNILNRKYWIKTIKNSFQFLFSTSSFSCTKPASKINKALSFR